MLAKFTSYWYNERADDIGRGGKSKEDLTLLRGGLVTTRRQSIEPLKRLIPLPKEMPSLAGHSRKMGASAV